LHEVSRQDRDLRIQSLALEALHEAAEAMIVTEFERKIYATLTLQDTLT